MAASISALMLPFFIASLKQQLQQQTDILKSTLQGASIL